jgi:DNA-binding NarL/FixJ family response regulator
MEKGRNDAAHSKAGGRFDGGTGSQMSALRQAIRATLREGRVDSAQNAIEPFDMAVMRERRAGLTRRQIAAKLGVDESAVFESLVRTYAWVRVDQSASSS